MHTLPVDSCVCVQGIDCLITQTRTVMTIDSCMTQGERRCLSDVQSCQMVRKNNLHSWLHLVAVTSWRLKGKAQRDVPSFRLYQVHDAHPLTHLHACTKLSAYLVLTHIPDADQGLTFMISKLALSIVPHCADRHHPTRLYVMEYSGDIRSSHSNSMSTILPIISPISPRTPISTFCLFKKKSSKHDVNT